MSGGGDAGTGITVGQVKTVKVFTFNLSGTGTQAVFTASGNVALLNLMFYVATSGTGFTSVAFQTNETTPRTLMTATIAATIVAGNNLLPYNTCFVLADTKTVSAIFVGTASGGQILVCAEYYKATGGDLN